MGIGVVSQVEVWSIGVRINKNSQNQNKRIMNQHFLFLFLKRVIKF